MAHYALLDENNIVTEVITGKEEGEDGVNWEQWYGEFRGQRCLRTSYNTKEGIHIYGGEPFRKNYAGIGYTYDDTRDAFIPPKPFLSWVFNETTCTWDSPVPKPTDWGQIDSNGDTIIYVWNEENQIWSRN